MHVSATIARFTPVGNFNVYCRCVDSVRERNGKKTGNGNNQNRNKYLTWAFVETANFAVRYCPQAKSFGESKKRKPNAITIHPTFTGRYSSSRYPPTPTTNWLAQRDYVARCRNASERLSRRLIPNTRTIRFPPAPFE